MSKKEFAQLKSEWLQRWDEMRCFDLDLYSFCQMKGANITSQEFYELAQNE